MVHPKNHHKCFARLACVKHAASVHPEPGSNSLKKFVQDQNLAWLIFYPVLFTLVLFFKNYILLNFQGYVTVQLSRFFVFRCSSATFTSYHVRFSLSRTFFNFFLKSFCSLELLSSISAAAPCDVDYHITPSAECQHLFLKFFIFFKLLIQLYYCIYNLLKINFLSIQPFFLLLMALCQEFKDLYSFLSALPGASLSPR